MGQPRSHNVQVSKDVPCLANQACLQFCSSNIQKSYWSKGLHSPKCDSCSVQDKYRMHICRCKDLGCDQLSHLTNNELHSWIESTLGNRAVTTTIGAYLCARGEITMQSLINDACTEIITVLEYSNRLGWDSLLKGHITQHWLLLVAPFLR